MRHRNYWEDEDDGISIQDNELSEQAEAWLEHQDGKEGDTVHCGHCGSAMHMSGSGGYRFQMSCAFCGVKGPLDDTRPAARALAKALFSTDP